MPGAISNSPTTSNMVIITTKEEEVQIPNPILESTFLDQWDTHIWTVLSSETRPEVDISRQDNFCTYMLESTSVLKKKKAKLGRKRHSHKSSRS